MNNSDIKRFWEKVDVRSEDECWLWKASINDGYGYFWTGYKMEMAHRTSWRLHNGPIPEDKFVLHKCDNRPCINPGHLYLGTKSDNMRDMVIRNPEKTVPYPRFYSGEIWLMRKLKYAGLSSRKICKMLGCVFSTIDSYTCPLAITGKPREHLTKDGIWI